MKKQWGATLFVLIVFAAIAIVAIVIYLQTTYLPRQEKISQLRVNLAKVEQQRNLWEQQQLQKAGQEETKNIDARFNILTSSHINETEVTGVVLQELQDYMSKKDISIQSLQELPVETAENGLVKYQYGLTGRAAFATVANLMKWLEIDKRAVIDGWNLPPTPFTSAWESDRFKNGLNDGTRPFQIYWHWVENVPLTYKSAPQLPGVEKIVRNIFAERRPKTKSAKKSMAKHITVYRLQAILSSKDGLSAVINGATLQQGQYIDKYRVVSVLSDRVVLKSPDGRLELKLPTQK